MGPGVHLGPPRPGYKNLADVAAPGTQIKDLDELSGSLTGAGMAPTIDETPVYAATAPIGPKVASGRGTTCPPT